MQRLRLFRCDLPHFGTTNFALEESDAKGGVGGAGFGPGTSRFNLQNHVLPDAGASFFVQGHCGAASKELYFVKIFVTATGTGGNAYRDAFPLFRGYNFCFRRSTFPPLKRGRKAGRHNPLKQSNFQTSTTCTENAACENRKRRTRKMQTPHAEIVISACGVSCFRVRNPLTLQEQEPKTARRA